VVGRCDTDYRLERVAGPRFWNCARDPCGHCRLICVLADRVFHVSHGDDADERSAPIGERRRLRVFGPRTV
jgi:hypothetical protein